MGNKTLTIIKPLAFKRGHTGLIIDHIIKAGFAIKAMKLIHLSKEQAERFYAVHKDKPFFQDLVDFMSAGSIVAMILEKENAVSEYRALMGATNPKNAEPGTLRNLFGCSMQCNAVHGSDSDENAEIECNFFFSTMEQVEALQNEQHSLEKYLACEG